MTLKEYFKQRLMNALMEQGVPASAPIPDTPENEFSPRREREKNLLANNWSIPRDGNIRKQPPRDGYIRKQPPRDGNIRTQPKPDTYQVLPDTSSPSSRIRESRKKKISFKKEF